MVATETVQKVEKAVRICVYCSVPVTPLNQWFGENYKRYAPICLKCEAELVSEEPEESDEERAERIAEERLEDSGIYNPDPAPPRE